MVRPKDFWIDGPHEFLRWHLIEKKRAKNRSSATSKPIERAVTLGESDSTVTSKAIDPNSTVSNSASAPLRAMARADSLERLPPYGWTGPLAISTPLTFFVLAFFLGAFVSLIFLIIFFIIAAVLLFGIATTKPNQAVFCVENISGARSVVRPYTLYIRLPFIYTYRIFPSGETNPIFLSVTTTSQSGATGTVRVSYTYHVSNPVAFFNNDNSRGSLEARIKSAVASVMSQSASLEGAVNSVISQNLGVALDNLGIEIGDVSFQSSELPYESMSFLNLLGAYLTASEHFQDKAILDRVFKSKFIETRELDLNLGIPALSDALVGRVIS